MNMVWHDDEGVQLEFAGVAITEERCDEEFGDYGSLEDVTALVSDGREGVGLRFQAHWVRTRIAMLREDLKADMGFAAREARACPGG